LLPWAKKSKNFITNRKPKMSLLFALFITAISFGNESNYFENYSYLSRHYPNGELRSRALIKKGDLNGFTELLPFVSMSPNQSGAGSCHFMALTGNAEFWLSKLNPGVFWEPNGPIDLSERFLMNINQRPELKKDVNNWRTDTIYVLNNAGGGILNKDYPFTKGWNKKITGEYDIVPALPNEAGAVYDTHYNWINETDKINSEFISLPTFKRDILFADPESNQWNIMIAPEDIVETVKNALIKNQAPVTVMYNNIGIWHVVMIVGFDDDLWNDDCYFTRNYENSLSSLISIRKKEYEVESDENAKTKLLGKIKKLETTKEKFTAGYKERGGCSGKGGFYVRDSVHSDPDGPSYDYFTGIPEDRQNYSKKVIIREYEWLKYFANHIWQIRADI
jgi:hypothetical protein